MTTGMLRVGYGALDQIAASLLQKGGAVGEKLDAMEGRMAARMPEWSGDDQTAYLAAKHEWDGAMSQMLAVLHDIARAVQLSREEYIAAERQNASRFGG